MWRPGLDHDATCVRSRGWHPTHANDVGGEAGQGNLHGESFWRSIALRESAIGDPVGEPLLQLDFEPRLYARSVRHRKYKLQTQTSWDLKQEQSESTTPKEEKNMFTGERGDVKPRPRLKNQAEQILGHKYSVPA